MSYVTGNINLDSRRYSCPKCFVIHDIACRWSKRNTLKQKRGISHDVRVKQFLKLRYPGTVRSRPRSS